MAQNQFGFVYNGAITENKELFLIEGATHIRTYWVPEYVDKAAGKMKQFLNLGKGKQDKLG